MNADRSAGRNTRQVKARTLAAYHTANPSMQEGGRLKGIDAGALVDRQAGQVAYTSVRIGVPNAVTEGCDCVQTTVCMTPAITNFVAYDCNTNGPFFPPNSSTGYGMRCEWRWDPIENTTYVSATVLFDVGQDTSVFIQYINNTSLYIYSNNDIYTADLTVVSSNCIPSSSGPIAPCFLAGALVCLADGSTKPIEDIRVGDIVLGAFGEHNTVLALHRPLLGNNTMTNINNDHNTSSHHPHISVDKKFYADKPAVVMSDTYGKSHEVLDENMVPYQRFLAGLKPGRVQQLEIGVELKTVNGSRAVTFLETHQPSPDTQLYNLVIDGSHTYHVDGYAVTGWPKEDDFDYDAWCVKN